jgi:hypothetical protein
MDGSCSVGFLASSGYQALLLLLSHHGVVENGQPHNPSHDSLLHPHPASSSSGWRGCRGCSCGGCPRSGLIRLLSSTVPVVPVGNAAGRLGRAGFQGPAGAVMVVGIVVDAAVLMLVFIVMVMAM